jgi:hypothetical protein
MICLNIFHLKQCYNQFEIVIYGIFYLKSFKRQIV